jgi:hypothetical protein
MLVILFLPRASTTADGAVRLAARVAPTKPAEPERPNPRWGPGEQPVPPGPTSRPAVRGLATSAGWWPSGFDLTVADGEILGLIGPNGAGKTTVFNMAACYFPPDAGQITFAGKSLIGLRPDQACALGIGRTFQVTKPFAESTVLANVMVGAFCRVRSAREARRVALEALDTVEFAHRRDVSTTSDRLRAAPEVAGPATQPRLLPSTSRSEASTRPRRRTSRTSARSGTGGLAIVLVETTCGR